MPEYGCTSEGCDARWSTETPARRRGGFYRCPQCDSWRGVSLERVDFDVYPDVTPDDGWLRLELEIALRELRDGTPPLRVFRDLTGTARQWLATHLSRRGWDIVAGVPLKRPGTGDPERERELRRNAGGASRRYGGSDEQFDRTSGDGPMRVNGWGRRW